MFQIVSLYRTKPQLGIWMNKDALLCIRFMHSYTQSKINGTLSFDNSIYGRIVTKNHVTQNKTYNPSKLRLSPTWPLDVAFYQSFHSRQAEAHKISQKLNEVDSAHIDALTQKIVTNHKIPPERSMFVRLGVLEGYLLKEQSKPSYTLLRNKLLRLLPVILIIGIYVFSKLPTAVKSVFEQRRFKSVDETGMISDIRFKDVGGVDEAKEELSDVVHFLKDPNKFTQLGAKLPKGILLVGAPGTGKTMLAKAVAGEAGVPFFYAAGSEFDETFVGVGAARVRKLFENARMQAPSIIFIDEIDACGSQRSNNPMQPYARQTINQLLQEMDGFQENESPVIVLGATNTAEALDKALTRPGRFDTEVQVQLPDIKGRKDLLEIYLAKTSTSPSEEINVDRLASLTIGMSGADISNVVNQGALQAAKMEKQCITQEDLEFALDKIRMGPESTSRVRTEEDLKKTAYHEAGHALVAYYTPAAWDIYKATIRQRGRALGHVSQIPSKEDENSMTKDKLLARIDVAMGGRVAEELLYGDGKVGTGASSDLEQATSTAYRLICDFGMSENLGLMKYHLDAVSEATKRSVDVEVKRFIELSYKRTKELLTNRSKEHKLLSEALIKYETLTMDEIRLTLENDDIEAVKKSRTKNSKPPKPTPRLDPTPDQGHTGIKFIPISMLEE